jgi:hypothetical protein
MRKKVWVLSLAACTAVLAAGTVHFLRDPAHERDAGVDATLAVAADDPERKSIAAASATAANSPADSTAGSPPEGRLVLGPELDTEGHPVNLEMFARMREAQARQATRLLSQLADGTQREELLASRRVSMRESYAGLPRVLRLPPAGSGQLFDLLARQQLEDEEFSAKCVAQPPCSNEDGANLRAAHERRLSELFGAGAQQTLYEYQRTRPERQSVDLLRTRLSGQSLSDDRAEALIIALAGERDAYVSQLSLRGAGLSGFGSAGVMVFVPSDARTFGDRVTAAEQYNDRLRQRAAEVLDADELAALAAMQEEALMALRQQLRQENQSISTTVINGQQ